MVINCKLYCSLVLMELPNIVSFMTLDMMRTDVSVLHADGEFVRVH
jgi:hypothetical protein